MGSIILYIVRACKWHENLNAFPYQIEAALHAEVLIGLYPLEADTAGGGDQF